MTKAIAQQPPRYSKISRKAWRSEDLRALSDMAKLLFLRLLSAPEMTVIPGVVAAWCGGLSHSMGWDRTDFDSRMGEIVSRGMAVVDDGAGVIWLPSAIKHNMPQSPNVIFGWAREWPELPESELKSRILASLSSAICQKGEAFREAFGKAFPDYCPKASGKPRGKGPGKATGIQEQEQEQEQEQNTHSGDLTGSLACEHAPVAKSDPVKQNPDPIPECVCESEPEQSIPATDLGLGSDLEASGYPASPHASKPIAESNSVATRKADTFRATFGAIPGPDTQIGRLWAAYLDNTGAGAKSARLDADRVRILDGLAREGETPETVAMATRGALSEDWGRKHCASLSALFGKRDQFEKYLALGKALCKSVDPDAARNERAEKQRLAVRKADLEKARKAKAEQVMFESMGYPNAWTFAEADMWREAKGLPLHRYDPEHECHQKERKVAG